MTAPVAAIQRPFAVFDVDGTVIRWQLYHAIVHELGKMGLLSPDANERIKQARLTWKKRSHTDSFRDYEITLVDAYHEAKANIDATVHDQAINRVFEHYKDQVYTYTRDLIRSLKAQGYFLMAISGSQQEIVEKLGEYYGFDVVVGTIYEHTPDGKLGAMLSSPVKGRGKGPILQELIKTHHLTFGGSYAVGDSKSDAAMLELVEHPIAFNPDKALFDIAREHGWPMVVERKNVIYTLKPQDEHFILAETN
jgi:HAD superfamily hydrolase (TIGR01490 family)